MQSKPTFREPELHLSEEEQSTRNDNEQGIRLPILSGIKDAYNSSLRIDLSDEVLTKLRRFSH